MRPQAIAVKRQADTMRWRQADTVRAAEVVNGGRKYHKSHLMVEVNMMIGKVSDQAQLKHVRALMWFGVTDIPKLGWSARPDGLTVGVGI